MKTKLTWTQALAVSLAIAVAYGLYATLIIREMQREPQQLVVTDPQHIKP